MIKHLTTLAALALTATACGGTNDEASDTGLDDEEVAEVSEALTNVDHCATNDVNADAFIFWQRKEADLQAGQTLMAQLVMDPAIQTMYSQITGSIPVRTDVDLSGEGWSEGQRTTSAALKSAIASNQALLSMAHNMAQENGMTAAMIDVITEYVKNKTIKPEQAVTRLAEAVESAR